MASRFRRGGVAYTKDGRRYNIDDVADGLVYCSSAEGAETEFPEGQLLNEAEWSARFGNKKEMLYSQLKQARIYTPSKGKFDRASSEQLLSKVERLFPGILDFVAFTVASRLMTESNNQDFIPELSIVKCREVFDAAIPETRVNIIAGFIGSPPDVLMSANALRDNLMRAMIEKGLASYADAFEAFRGRRRQ